MKEKDSSNVGTSFVRLRGRVMNSGRNTRVENSSDLTIKKEEVSELSLLSRNAKETSHSRFQEKKGGIKVFSKSKSDNEEVEKFREIKTVKELIAQIKNNSTNESKKKNDILIKEDSIESPQRSNNFLLRISKEESTHTTPKFKSVKTDEKSNKKEENFTTPSFQEVGEFKLPENKVTKFNVSTAKNFLSFLKRV